ncbi:MAG: TIGR01906 family membrane protein [Candidatus Methanomethyliaceae archaeon]
MDSPKSHRPEKTQSAAKPSSVYEVIQALRPQEEELLERRQPLLSWLVSLILPIALVLSGVRLLLTPWFLQVEYRTPNFPPDPFGFTLEDRLYWSQIALEYLLNDQGIEFLGDLRFANGRAVYNPRELAHMVDVKNVVRYALYAWYGSLGVLLLLALVAALGKGWRDFCLGLARGGWLTVILVGLITLFVLLGFGIFFVFFHEVFFDPGTWTFAYSDTLIRLFPERFWRDAFLAVGGFAILTGLLLALGFRER